MSTISAFKDLDLNSIVCDKPPRSTGNKAKLVFLTKCSNISSGKTTQRWPIRPSDDTCEKFTLEVEGTEDLNGALKAFDQRVRKLAFENKSTWFSKNVASEITAENDLKQMHHSCLTKGNDKPDGSKYPDTFKVKVSGWKDYVQQVKYKGEGDKKFPVDVQWKSRILDSVGNGGPEDHQTKFYLSQGRDMATGKQRMVAKVPSQDPAGNQMRDSNGNLIWEAVGPKHCQPGSEITVVLSGTVWIAAKFGVSFTAKQVFITPPPPKARNIVEGIEIVDVVDPLLATRAVQLAVQCDDLRNLDEIPADEEDTSSNKNDVFESAPHYATYIEETLNVSGAEAVTNSPTTKRASTAKAPSAAKKTKKTTSMEDEF